MLVLHQFYKRIIEFHESFDPLGKWNQNKKQPLAIMWYEATTKEKKEDLISSLHAFLLHHRNTKNFSIWFHNCKTKAGHS